jgi:hypothetical protein
MLNMIIDFAYEPAKVVSYSTWATEMKKFDSIASTAANLTLMIPFLSFWITRMGEGGFMHLAGSIMATANSASSALAGEKASGSRSWDNESIRNQNNDNTSSYKHDSSMQYVSGSVRNQTADGSMETITAGGKALYFSGAGQSSSSGESSYRQMSGWSANYDESIRYETQAMRSETAARSQAQEKLYAAEASALHSIMQHTKEDNGYNIDTSTEEGRELTRHLSEIDKLNSTNNHGWEQNAKAHAAADAGFSLPKLLLGAKISVGGEVSAGNSSSQSDSQSNEISSDVGTNNRQSTSERTSNMQSFSESLGVDKNTQSSVRENYQEVARLDKSISEHKSKIDSHNETMNYGQSHSGEMSKDMYQDVADRYQQKYGGSAREAQEAASSGTDKARGVFKELTQKSYQDKFNEIHNRGNKIANSNNVDDFMQSNRIDSSIGSRVDEFAKVNNIRTDKANVEQEIHNTGAKLKSEHANKYDTNQEGYDDTQIKSTDTQNAKQKQMDKYEEDRIGMGAISTNITEKLDLITNGKFGKNIGRPTEKSYSNNDLDLGDPIAKPYEPQVGRYNWETGQIDPLPQGSKHTSRINAVNPPKEAEPYDATEVQEIMEQFNPDTTHNNKRSNNNSRAEYQYVDPKTK